MIAIDQYSILRIEVLAEKEGIKCPFLVKTVETDFIGVFLLRTMRPGTLGVTLRFRFSISTRVVGIHITKLIIGFQAINQCKSQFFDHPTRRTNKGPFLTGKMAVGRAGDGGVFLMLFHGLNLDFRKRPIQNIQRFRNIFFLSRQRWGNTDDVAVQATFANQQAQLLCSLKQLTSSLG